MIDVCVLQLFVEFGDQFECFVDVFKGGMWSFKIVWVGQVVGIDWFQVGQFQQCVEVFVDIVVCLFVGQFDLEVDVVWYYCDLLWFDFDYVQFGEQVQVVEFWYDQQFVVGVVEVVVLYVCIGCVQVDVYVVMCIWCVVVFYCVQVVDEVGGCGWQWQWVLVQLVG